MNTKPITITLNTCVLVLIFTCMLSKISEDLKEAYACIAIVFFFISQLLEDYEQQRNNKTN